MNLSIVIVNWNTRDLLAGCLASVYAYPPPGEFEIWVVDNASTDESAEMVRERFPEVKLIESPENTGFARANNKAIRQCTGRYVMLLNPDTELRPGAMETLVSFMDAHPRVGAAGPYLLNADQSLQVSCYPLPTLAREFWRLFYLDILWPFGVYNMSRWDPNQVRSVGVLKGACVILRGAALDQIGLMDEDYFMYTEEVDLCYRLKKGGWDLVWVPQAKVVHFGGQSVHQVAAEMFLLLYGTKVLYFRKNHGLLSSWIFKFILLLAILPRVVMSPLAWLKRPPKRDRYLTIARQYRRLLVSLPSM